MGISNMGVHSRYSQRNLDNLRKALYEVKITGYKQCQQELETAKKEYNERKGTMTRVLELEKRLEKHIPSEIHFIENNIKAIENAIRTGKYPDVSDGWGGTVPGKAWIYKDEPAKIEKDGYRDGPGLLEIVEDAASGALIGLYVGVGVGIFGAGAGAVYTLAKDIPTGNIQAAIPSIIGGGVPIVLGPIIGAIAGAIKSRKY